MRRILTIIFGAALVVACSNKETANNLPESGLRLSVSTSTVTTKAAVAGEDVYNENQISIIHYFIYTDGNTDSAPVKHDVLAVNAVGSKTLNIPLQDTDFEQLIFPDGATSAEIFVLANCSETAIAAIATKSVENLKAMAVSFADANAVQDNFVMWGEGSVTNASHESTYSATSSISLKRVSSKISLKINVARVVTDEGEIPEVDPGSGEGSEDEDPDNIWSPVVSAMSVRFIGGANNAVISGNVTAAEAPFNTCERSSAEGNAYTFTASATDSSDPYHGTSYPFYSYPRSWTPATDEEPFFLITLPWQKGEPDDTQSDSNYRLCYYKMVFSNTSFNSNDWYDITLMISAMPADGETVVVRPLDFKVAGWEESITTHTGGDEDYNTVVDIDGTRFLTTKQTEYVLYNQESLTLDFKSSHPLQILNKRTDSANDAKTSDYSVDVMEIVGANSINRKVEFYHPIENDQTQSKYDYKEYKVTFRVQHKTSDTSLDAGYYEDITIIQKPALCISSENWHDTSSSTQGNTVFVDGNKRSNSQPSSTSSSNYPSNYYQRISGGTEGSTHNLIQVDVSVLPDGSSYIIADPRIRTNQINVAPYNSTSFQKNSAPHIDGTSGYRLQYYYPSSDENANMIAPSFRIATKYGSVNGDLSLDEAKLRCASYQEAGYPAGRWRLPTRAELLYVIGLQKMGYIENVYAGSHGYWSATVGFSYTDGNEPTEKALNTRSSVRCVYDSWYWDNSVYPRTSSPYTTFTWGDAEIF